MEVLTAGLLNIAVIALAASAITTAWFYGEIFAKLYQKFENKDTFFGKLMTCPLCFSYHAAFFTAVLLWLPGAFLSDPWVAVARIPLYSLAATTLVHYIHGILPIADETDDEDGSGTDGSGT